MSGKNQRMSREAAENIDVLWPNLNLEPLFADAWHARWIAARRTALLDTQQDIPRDRAA
jgi:hypothetical protein